MTDIAISRDTFQARLPDVQLAVLFGSQAKGKATARSDWDIAVLAKPGAYEGIQQFILQRDIASTLSLPFDNVDLVDLRRCSSLLAFVIAREGKLLYEATPAAFHLFQVRASKIYADTAKLRKLQRIYIGYPTEGKAKE